MKLRHIAILLAAGIGAGCSTSPAPQSGETADLVLYNGKIVTVDAKLLHRPGGRDPRRTVHRRRRERRGSGDRRAEHEADRPEWPHRHSGPDRRSSAQRRWRTRRRSLRGALDGRAAGRGRGAREEHAARRAHRFQRDWHEAQLREKRLPHRTELDRVAPGNPVVLVRGGHEFIVNSAALARWNITRETKSPPGGEIGHDPDGSLNGELVDTARSLVKLPPPPKLTPEALEAQMKLLNAVGLTGVRIPGGVPVRPGRDRPLPHVPAIEGAGAAHHARELPDAHLRLLERGEGEGDHRLVERAPGRRRRVAEDRRHEDAGRRRLRGRPHARALRRALRTRRRVQGHPGGAAEPVHPGRARAQSAGLARRHARRRRRGGGRGARRVPGRERRALDRRKALDDRALLHRPAGPVPDREGARHRGLGAGPPLPRGAFDGEVLGPRAGRSGHAGAHLPRAGLPRRRRHRLAGDSLQPFLGDVSLHHPRHHLGRRLRREPAHHARGCAEALHDQQRQAHLGGQR